MNTTQDSPHHGNCLGVFGKFWQAGKVKTRLAKTIGGKPASLVYQAFLRTILRRFSGVADRRVLAYWPRDRLREFADLAGPCWELTPQVADQCRSDHDLGRRMQDFFALRFARGAKRVVLIGSDSPTLPVKFVERAFAALADQQVVVGPAADGGYYLVGMSEFEPRIFDEISWSTARVYSQTLARFQQLQLPFRVLPEWHDVDDLADLLRLRNQLQAARSPDKHCEELLMELDVLLSELPS